MRKVGLILSAIVLIILCSCASPEPKVIPYPGEGSPPPPPGYTYDFPPEPAPEPVPTPTPSPVPEPIPEALPMPTIEPQFKPIIITGAESKTSPPFIVTAGEWIIDWSYEIDPEYEDIGAVFSFFVYPRGETEVFVESILFPDKTSGSTYSYAGAGEYYIKVIAVGIESWEVIIRPAQ